MTSSVSNEVVIYYDHECPVCRNYCRFLRLKQTSGSLRLVNAREDHALSQKFLNQGMDIDQGIIVSVGGNYYHGSDALHMLALLSTGTGWFNRLNARLFSSRRISRIFYPLMVVGRNLLLRLLGKERILNKDNVN